MNEERLRVLGIAASMEVDRNRERAEVAEALMARNVNVYALSPEGWAAAKGMSG